MELTQQLTKSLFFPCFFLFISCRIKFKFWYTRIQIIKKKNNVHTNATLSLLSFTEHTLLKGTWQTVKLHQKKIKYERKVEKKIPITL